MQQPEGAAAPPDERESYAAFVLDAFGAADFELDLATGALRPSARLNALLGYPAGRRLTLEDCRARYHPDDRAAIAADFAEARAGVRPRLQREFRVVHPGGEVRWVLFRGEVVGDAAGRPALIRGAAIDMTEHRQTERALRETERKLGTLFELLPVGVSILDAQGVVAYANPALEQILRLDRSGLLAGAYLSRTYLRPDGTPMPPEEYASARSLRARQPVADVETGVVTEAGEVIWTSVSAAPVDFPDWRTLIVTSDITARKQAEADARAALEAERAMRLAAERASARTAQLQAVSAGLAGALTSAAVVDVIAEHGVAATGASVVVIGLLDDAGEQLEVAGWVGHGVVNMGWRTLPLSADTPPGAAVCAGEPVWLRSRDEAGARFPGFGRLMARVGDHALATLPLRASDGVLGTISLAYPAPNPFCQEDQAFLLTLAQQCAQALERARLYAEVLASHERQQQLAQRLLLAQEEERRHLARELHDEVGQELTGLRLALEMAGRVAADECAGRLAEAQRTAQELIARIRALSLDLRPAMLDDAGLLPAMLWQLRRFREQTGIAVELRHQGLERRLGPAAETVAYRVVQEALTNVARHAGVEAATVTLLASPARLLAQVRDEGRGFDCDEVLRGGHSSGLAGMRERVALLGGALSIETEPGGGTCVTAELPLGEEAQP